MEKEKDVIERVADVLLSDRLRRALFVTCKVYLVGILISLIVGFTLLFLDSCGSSGEIASGNTTNVFINSYNTGTSTRSTVSLISDDYRVDQIETKDDGNIVSVTLIRK